MLDGGQMWTLDLYATEGSSQSDVTMWESGLLLYGSHSVIISQLGIDSRIGCVTDLQGSERRRR